MFIVWRLRYVIMYFTYDLIICTFMSCYTCILIGAKNSHYYYKDKVKCIWGECVLFVHNTHITPGPTIPHSPLCSIYLCVIGSSLVYLRMCCEL